jgi:GAF domain-containing protein
MLTSPDPTPAIEYRLRHADGDWRVVESRTSNKLEDPAIEGLVVNTRDITPRKRAEERLRENKAKIERLHDTAAALADCESERAIYERTVEVAESILAFDICVVDVEEDGLLRVAASRGLPEGKSPTLSVEEGLAGETYRTGRSSLVTDTRESAVAMPQGTYLSVLSVPVGDHGVFQAAAEEVDAFDQDDLELAELLVTHTASALDRVERETRLRRQAEQLSDIADHTTADLQAQLGTARRQLEHARTTEDAEALETVADAHDQLAETVEELLALAEADVEPRVEAESRAE